MVSSVRAYFAWGHVVGIPLIDGNGELFPVAEDSLKPMAITREFLAALMKELRERMNDKNPMVGPECRPRWIKTNASCELYYAPRSSSGKYYFY